MCSSWEENSVSVLHHYEGNLSHFTYTFIFLSAWMQAYPLMQLGTEVNGNLDYLISLFMCASNTDTVSLHRLELVIVKNILKYSGVVGLK